MQTTRSNPETIARPVGAYSHAVRVQTADATWIYVSGQIANDPEGTLVAPNELPAQTEQVFENLRAILEANGATFADVVKIHTYFTTLDGLAESREVRLGGQVPKTHLAALGESVERGEVRMDLHDVGERGAVGLQDRSEVLEDLF